MNNTTDVYNRTIFARNSIQEIPSNLIDGTANDLFRFLGSFWRNIHEGREFLKGAQKVRSIKLAQFYLDLLETLKLQDRKGAPVFHRELWKPLTIRKSRRDTSQENILHMDDGVKVGRQGEDSKYGDVVLSLGSLAALKGYVTYPVEGDIKTIVSGIANNVINPTEFYTLGTSFPDTSVDVIYINGTLIFPKDKDPFAAGSKFEAYDVLPEEGEDPSLAQEITLWASDVLIDRDYIATHMSYALGITCPSTEITKRILNAGWDAINCGLTPELLRTLLAALANIPVIQETQETVLKVTKLPSGQQTVTTDKHSYTVSATSELRSEVLPGCVLHRGDFLDQAIKVYPLLTEPTEEKIEGTTEYADILKTDVPIITIPRALLKTKTTSGLYVDWTPVPVLWDGEEYAEGRRKIYFPIGGSDEDVKAFWEDVWSYAAQNDIDLDEIFTMCEPEISADSDPDSWTVIPAAFFLKHFLGGNTIIITIDRSQLETTSFIRNPMFFDIINEVVPSGMRLFFIEHITVEGDEYNLDTPVPGTEESPDHVDVYAYEEMEDEFFYNDLPGMKGKRIPTYEDQVELKFFRNRKRNAN